MLKQQCMKNLHRPPPLLIMKEKNKKGEEKWGEEEGNSVDSPEWERWRGKRCWHICGTAQTGTWAGRSKSCTWQCCKWKRITLNNRSLNIQLAHTGVPPFFKDNFCLIFSVVFHQRDRNLHGKGNSLSKTILQGTLGGGKCHGWQGKCWKDNIKE